jgi:WS/DGAT/MGAT family acyltransferase
MQKLSGQDALFLHLDLPHAASHVTMIYIYDQSGLAQPLRFRQIVGHIEERLDASPMFCSKIVQTPLGLAYPYWAADPDFDIDFHVRHFALPQPGDWRQFCILAARLHARPLDLARPPWEMYVIEGLDHVDWLPKGSFAVITKIHHAAIDGAAAAELTWTLHDAVDRHGKPVPVLATRKPLADAPAAPSLADTIGRIVADNVVAPLNLAAPLSRVLPRLSLAAYMNMSRKLMTQGAGVPRTRFNDRVSSKRVFESVVLELAAIKRIRAAVPGATVNDAVLAVIGGAMRRYLASKDELPKESLVALAPVNTRQEAAQTSGNSISFLTFPLASDIADPLERLARIREATSKTKTMSEAIGAGDLADISKHAPPATLAAAGRMATLAGLGGLGSQVLHNCLVTNVPGPKAELTMLGARLRYWSGMAPITDGVGAVFAVSSYNDRLSVSLTSCPEMVTDPAFFGDCIRASIEEADAAARSAAKPIAVVAGTKARVSKRSPAIAPGRRTRARAGTSASPKPSSVA